MDVAALFLHNFRSGPCPAWVIEGAEEQDASKLKAALSQYMAYAQDAGFNEWRIWTCGNGRFGAKRFTWEMAWYGTLDELLAKFSQYYERRAV